MPDPTALTAARATSFQCRPGVAGSESRVGSSPRAVELHRNRIDAPHDANAAGLNWLISLTTRSSDTRRYTRSRHFRKFSDSRAARIQNGRLQESDFLVTLYIMLVPRD